MAHSPWNWPGVIPPGTEIIPELHDPRDLVVRGKKRYSSFHGTDLEFVLRRRLAVDTLVLAGINTSSCVLNAGFDATNRDFRVVVAADAVDSMDGEDMHRFALRLMGATVGWPLTTAEILTALDRERRPWADPRSDPAETIPDKRFVKAERTAPEILVPEGVESEDLAPLLRHVIGVLRDDTVEVRAGSRGPLSTRSRGRCGGTRPPSSPSPRRSSRSSPSARSSSSACSTRAPRPPGSP